jgi:hypothetical protein
VPGTSSSLDSKPSTVERMPSASKLASDLASSGLEALNRGFEAFDRRTGVGPRVHELRNLLPRESDPSSVESEQSSRKNPIRRPWNRASHPWTRDLPPPKRLRARRPWNRAFVHGIGALTRWTSGRQPASRRRNSRPQSRGSGRRSGFGPVVPELRTPPPEGTGIRNPWSRSARP